MDRTAGRGHPMSAAGPGEDRGGGSECSCSLNIARATIIEQDLVPILLHELHGVAHGVITVEVHVRDAKLARFVVKRERSVIPGQHDEAQCPCGRGER